MHTDGKWQGGKSLRLVRTVVHSRDCRRRQRRRCHYCGHHHRRHAGSKYTHKSMPPDGQSLSLVSLSTDDVTARIIYARLVCGTRKRLDESSGIRVPRTEEKEEILRLLCLVISTRYFVPPNASSVIGGSWRRKWGNRKESCIRLVTDDRESSSLQHHREYGCIYITDINEM